VRRNSELTDVSTTGRDAVTQFSGSQLAKFILVQKAVSLAFKNFTPNLRIPYRLSSFTDNVIYFKTARRNTDALRGSTHSPMVEVAVG